MASFTPVLKLTSHHSMQKIGVLLFLLSCMEAHAQDVHPNAHSHNDYAHTQPLWEALDNGFISVEADVHLANGELLVSHDRPNGNEPTLQQLYLAPLDSLIKSNQGHVYKGYSGTFYLMIDFKTEAVSTYHALLQAVSQYPSLLCHTHNCPLKIFISGNRPVQTLAEEGYKGIALDGRPEDLGKGYSVEQMPVVSDNYNNWSAWRSNSEPVAGALDRSRELAERVHAEGKKLRLWAHPDNELAWEALLEAGVDLINTDRLEDLSTFLKHR